MKNLLLIVLMLSMLASCGKEDDFSSINEKLEGYWLLTDITGGFAGTGYEADFDHLQINGDQVYALMIHDAVIQEGTYQLREEEDNWVIQYIPADMDNITFDNEEKTILFNEEGNVLTLSDPCCDLYVYRFIKDE